MISYQEPKRNKAMTLMDLEERKENIQKLGASFFKLHMLPTLIYAVMFSLLMVHNVNSITMPIWVVETIVYCLVVFRNNEVEYRWERHNIFYVAVMVLLGISTMLTTSGILVFLNYVGFFLMLLVFLFHNICEDQQWEMGDYLINIVRAVFGPISVLDRPFADFFAYFKINGNTEHKHRKEIVSAVIGVVCAIPCLLILGSCLASADGIFEGLIVETLSHSLFSVNTIWDGGILFVFGFFSAYCGIRFLLQQQLTTTEKSDKKMGAIAPIAFLGSISLMYVVFCGIQIRYLFLKNGELPQDMTYAQYARTGFFQLLFVCAVNLVLVLAMGKYVKKNKVLNALLVLFCGCTFIMIASSTYRMLLYIAAYYLTFTRVFVLVALLLLSFLMIGATIYIFVKSFPIFRYSMVVVSIIYVAFSLAKPDYWIASYNLSQREQGLNGNLINYNDTSYVLDIHKEYGDLEYLYGLSLDAAPVMVKYLSNNELERYASRNSWDMADWSLRHFNVSRYYGKRMLEEKMDFDLRSEMDNQNESPEEIYMAKEKEVDGIQYDMVVEYQGRDYLECGVVKDSLDKSEIGQVIGLYNYNADPDGYVEEPYGLLCTIKGREEYLVCLPAVNAQRNLVFFRDESTYGKKIGVPEYIDNFDNSAWK